MLRCGAICDNSTFPVGGHSKGIFWWLGLLLLKFWVILYYACKKWVIIGLLEKMSVISMLRCFVSNKSKINRLELDFICNTINACENR